MKWSHEGKFLATGGRDTVIILNLFNHFLE
jgi:hypothetical protein